MTNVKFLILFFLAVLPSVIFSSTCPLTISQTLLSSGKHYNTYQAVLHNTQSVTASKITFSTSASLHSIDDVNEVNSGYQMEGQTTIQSSQTYSFTYQVAVGTTPMWSITCTMAAAPATSAPKAQPTVTSTKGKATTAPVKATTAPVKATTAPVKATTAPVNNNQNHGSSSTITGKICPAGTWWRPRPSTTWQWQLTGTIDTSYNVQMYDIDMFDNDASVIQTLHDQGRVVICYFSTQYESWRPDANLWTTAVIGNALDDWPGENYVDIRSPVTRSIMQERLDYAVSKGCDGVEPDNVDGYAANTGFPLTAADQLDFNQFVANEAHARGLSVGLKNDPDQAKALQPYFDWALNEQCHQYSECSSLSPFITNNKAVFNCEYSGSASSVCPTQDGLKFSSLLKSLDLTAAIKAQCCTYASAGCAPALYDCVSA